MTFDLDNRYDGLTWPYDLSLYI